MTSDKEKGMIKQSQVTRSPVRKNGEQVEYTVGIRENDMREGGKTVRTFNGMSRREIEERKMYKYRGKS